MDQMKAGGGAEEVDKSTALNDYESSSTTLSAEVVTVSASNDSENVPSAVSETITAILEHVVEDAKDVSESTIVPRESSPEELSSNFATPYGKSENIIPAENVPGNTITPVESSENPSITRENTSGNPTIPAENVAVSSTILVDNVSENSSRNPTALVENAVGSATTSAHSVANAAVPEENNSENATTLAENKTESTTALEEKSSIENAAAATGNDSEAHRSTMTDSFSDSISPNVPFLNMDSKNKSISTLKTCLGMDNDDQFETDSDLDNSWSSAEFMGTLGDFCRMRVSRTLHNGEGEFAATEGEDNFRSDIYQLRQKVPFPVPDVHIFKIVFVGDPNVGKTSIVQRYSRRCFMESYVPTIGVDFHMRLVKLDDIGFVRLLIFDLAGEERVSQISKVYYRRTHGAVCVYDESNMQGFDNILRWTENVRDAVAMPEGSELPIVLLGNKCDLLSEEEKEQRDKSDFAKEHGFLGAYHTSAKLDIGINEAMLSLIMKMVEMEKKGGLTDNDAFTLGAEESSRTNCFGNSNSCCS